MFDLHVHTIYSLDGQEKPEKIAKYLKKKGFIGMAIVDHSTLKGALKIKLKDFIIVPGMEINTKKGHILALGIKEEIRSKEAKEIIEETREKGGISVLAHPFRFSKPKIKADAVEALNGRCFPVQNKRAYEYVMANKFPYTAGSDGHFLWEMGKAYAIINAKNVDDVLDAIMKKDVEIGIENENSIWHPIKCKIYATYDFIKRGFKRVK